MHFRIGAGEHSSFRSSGAYSAGGGGAFEYKQGSMVVLGRGSPLQLEEGVHLSRGAW